MTTVLRRKKLFLIVGMFLILFFLFFILPNVFNTREQKAFSNKARFQKAQQQYKIEQLGDSVAVKAGGFYKRSGLHLWLFGQKYRTLWDKPVKVRVLDMDTVKGGLKEEKKGGGMQTIGLDLLSKSGKAYDLRSVNKDQSKALPGWLQYSYTRVMFRDQTAALNPYAALVVPTLAKAADILHTHPTLYFVPYNNKVEKEVSVTMAGRLAILEEKPDKTWVGSPVFNFPEAILDTDEMIEKAQKENLAVDTVAYLRCRLFDILISDWDRHEGQWEWALLRKDDGLIFEPIPKDRDMAFYKFNEGVLSFVALAIIPKFQSFTPDYENVSGLAYNSAALDQQLLPDFKDSSFFVATAKALQSKITDPIIVEAFHHYPPEIFELVGKEHIKILKARRDKLDMAAKEFYEVVNGD